ncbi:MAG TPA: hypothetical protein VGG44_00455 [Tepidisphaeraceae bacterium]|jgi:hypothetical protein
MSFRRIAFLSLAGVALFAASAKAGMVTANFADPEGIDTINFDNSFGYVTGPDAAIVNATRTDTPGFGVDTLLPTDFRVFCTELGQDIQVTAVSTFFNVIPLSLNPSTDPGNVTGPVTFTPALSANVEKLFGNFYPNATDTTQNDAFQLALWDIVFSDNLTLVQDPSDSNDRLWVDPSQYSTPVNSLAESYLSAIKADLGVNALSEANVVLLTDPSVQDQLALIPGTVSGGVPEPTTLSLLIPAGLMMLRGRRRGH